MTEAGTDAEADLFRAEVSALKRILIISSSSLILPLVGTTPEQRERPT